MLAASGELRFPHLRTKSWSAAMQCGLRVHSSHSTGKSTWKCYESRFICRQNRYVPPLSLSHSSQEHHPIASGDCCGICRQCSHFRRRPTTDRFFYPALFIIPCPVRVESSVHPNTVSGRLVARVPIDVASRGMSHNAASVHVHP